MGKFLQKGDRHTEEAIRKMMIAQLGTKHHAWKGDEASYSAIHKWVNSHFGKAFWCTFCFKVGTGKHIHWANISHQYKRDTNDWFQLCASCHKYYDLEFKRMNPQTQVSVRKKEG